MAGLFTSIKVQKNKRNVFDLSHDVKLSMDMGKLVPSLVLPVVPGDKFTISNEALVRFAPMLAPVMHRYDVSSHYFFVPNRILWPNWEKFIRNGTDSGDPLDVPAHPYVNVGFGCGHSYNKTLDYMGIPPWNGVAGGNSDQNGNTIINPLPFSAYQLIWTEFFRDQNADPNTVWSPLTDGDNNAAFDYLTQLRERCWEHDYFTSALPFSQRGPDVLLPLQEFKDVPVHVAYAPAAGDTYNEFSTTSEPTTHSAEGVFANKGVPDSYGGTVVPGSGELFAETSEIAQNPTTIRDFRRASKLQEWFERMAIGGARYAEQLWAFFNVRNQDARLQRPEYICGLKTPVMVSEVLNTTGTTDLPQGNMSGHGISVGQAKNGHYFAPEHGYIICVMSVMPKTCYQQGLDKHWLKVNDFTDHYWPQFAHIGEQEILKNEVYAYGPNFPQTFGYIPRYAEYKFMNSRVCGQFRTSYAYWHSGRIFNSEPSFNSAFVQSEPTKRIFAVTDPDVDSLICHVLHKIKAVRQMPKFGTPHI